MAEHIKYNAKNQKTLDFETKQGGDIDAFGDEMAKKGSDLDVKGGNAQNAKDLTKVDAMGTEEPKKGNKGMKTGKNDHLACEYDVNPMGTDAGKGGYRKNVG